MSNRPIKNPILKRKGLLFFAPYDSRFTCLPQADSLLFLQMRTRKTVTPECRNDALRRASTDTVLMKRTPEQLKGEGNENFNIQEISETVQRSPRFMYKLYSYSSFLIVCGEKKPQSISSWISGGSFISSKLLLLLHMG